MFKVLIIDDEPIIRKGLRNIINWRNYDCEVCGEASDGHDGTELVNKFLPDIIITDIRMPEVDGLAMIRRIRDKVPECKIIILTGYRDFEYVQEAIKLGAFDFILKPSKVGELTTVIGRAVKELKAYEQRLEEMSKLKSHFEQNIPILKEKLFYDIIYGINTNEQEIQDKMSMLNLKIDDFLLIVAESSIDDNDEDTSQYDKHLFQYGIINTFEETFSERFEVSSISLNSKQVAFIMQKLIPEEKTIETINDKCVHILEIIKNCFDTSITISISSEGKNVLELPSKLKECLEALQYKFYVENSPVIFYNDLGNFYKYEDYSLLEKYQKSLIDFIKSGNEAAVRSKLHDISKYISGLNKVDKEYFKNFYWNTISSINSIRISVMAADSETNAERGDISNLYKLIEECENIKDLNDILEEVSAKVTSRVNNYNKKSIKLGLQKAIDFIQEHYNEQITLNEVAQSIYVSSYYISRLFKKELGKNFVDYLNEIRINKSKELLKDIRYKTYEIAEMVGIPDAHYFSKLFKKYEGVTPTEYRDSKKQS